ncbi:MAG TPA: type II secretion system F family protein [Candidatus Nanoarchaeia archaeon]|nr:type II secretion system F family protein [Candidatus Nanoarchaeia archaeon]
MDKTKTDNKKNSRDIGQEKTERKSFLATAADMWFNFQGVSVREKLVFIQNLSVMIKAGIPILSSFRTLADQTESKTFSRVIKQIALKLEQGSTLSDALKMYPRIFNELFVNMIGSGEISGKLEDVLGQLYLQTKKQYELTSRIKGALTYPIIVVAAMIGIGVFMMVFVIPKITSVFTESNVPLPLFTRILIDISDFLTNQWLISSVAAVIIIFGAWSLLRTERGKYFFQGIILRLPIIGPITKKVNLARFSRTAGSLLKTDIMIVNAFKITANVVSNLHYRKAILEISEQIKKGGQINEIIKNYPRFFPPMVTQMITVGEQTGEVTDILADLAEFYESEVDQIMQNLPSIIEPVLILLLGLGVGAIAVAVIMPMYSLTSTI